MCNKQQKTHVHLPLQEKINIIKSLNNGSTKNKLREIAEQYHISPSVVSRLKKNSESLKDVENLSPKVLQKRKVKKPVHNADLEKVLIRWFNEKRAAGEPVSGPLICEKALVLNEQLNGSENFKASNGWLHAFKKRYGIRQLSMKGEKLSADVDAAISFAFYFQNLVEEEGCDLSLIFNADESGVYWKRLPEVTLAGANEDYDCPGWKLKKDRVTVLFCSNADGSFTLPLLVIGKSERPRCFNNNYTTSLPVTYTHQASAWMNAKIFFSWYKDQFIPLVQAMQVQTQKYGKVLLLLDNANCHPPKEILNNVNENFKVEFLPPNVTSLIQPMDQGVFAKAKTLYRKDLLRLLILKNDHIAVQDFMKSFNLRDCCCMLAKAFQSLTQENLQNAWNKLRGISRVMEKNSNDSDNSTTISQMHAMVNKIKGLEKVDRSEVKEWLSEDQHEPGWKQLSDCEIIEIVTGKNPQTIAKEKLHERKIFQSIEPNSISIPSSEDINTTVHILHNWCKQKNEYTLSDYRLFRKWENLTMKKSQEEVSKSSDANNSDIIPKL
ncbi:jerky protein homolog-like [Leptopilina boulardi]|uniref:jerky protein homolog-like n=1 Tax=Leptopilina boulardi TaxID=63433 RepID=UPI0021F6580B|nr:jerky protein homolog-like [Leptopilina boulardi]XP_051158268.1 jerky protein homolog-like [Leptopilina boulardi]XP_051160149.1 jerky protein homolog-like [Leptopilina boulardi]XP_051162761.1 jerky protein homolog-like [Leptopilina boulardi]XP_051169709.1 jerky protein homolog-like [Leptopilina boulardi]XP_051172790.1 jerky protein homolog-like [Leptopilina boulardi]